MEVGRKLITLLHSAYKSLKVMCVGSIKKNA